MNRTEIICECPFGHDLHVTPYVDANGRVRFICSHCIVCAGIAESNDKDELINLIE